ncbi:hypothetical protein EV361DRAFT_955507 [Lentinula raphanica]|uniref:Uncharacterized protein n=1 Tax=Lentinula raphanica TaxID=153919 RepID=A0AA38U3C7_9AGAR|nr:hypothetical protein C8R42DRAFT_729755 [Lentinula raphanica]KAJ3831612.1 hypothetical protein F5878DRAFT_667370 [Lentinula raphanica]KAJ3964909.1 hypothetical protein EV361DRAFT_955507 [Lentinula raphanica]
MDCSRPSSPTPLFLDQKEMPRPQYGIPMVDRVPLELSSSSHSPTTSLKKGVRFASVPAVDSMSDPRANMDMSSSMFTPRSPTPFTCGGVEPSSEVHTGIPKPEGEAGRPGRGGYNLQTILNWPNKRFKEVKGFIRTRAIATMNCSLPFSEQPLPKIQAIRDEAVIKFPFLSSYENLWVVDDFLRSRIKYEKSSIKRKADAKLAEEAREEAKRRLTISIPASSKRQLRGT